MDLRDVLLAIHFLGLFMGGAASLGLPVIGAVASRAAVEHRMTLVQVVKPLKMIGHAGLALLVLTGGALSSMGGLLGTSGWFNIKLVAVVFLIAGVYLAGRAGREAMQGDATAAGRARLFGLANIALAVFIVFSAVLAFH